MLAKGRRRMKLGGPAVRGPAKFDLKERPEAAAQLQSTTKAADPALKDDADKASAPAAALKTKAVVKAALTGKQEAPAEETPATGSKLVDQRLGPVELRH